MIDVENLINSSRAKLRGGYERAERTAQFNQEKVLNAFKKNRISAAHMQGSTGYGYDDIGRTGLCRVFSDVFCAQDAIVSPLIVSGTHAIVLSLGGLLRPGSTMLSVTGNPYDTLEPFFFGDNICSLKDLGVHTDILKMVNGSIDIDNLIYYFKHSKPHVVYIQRSRGYTQRNALSIDVLRRVCGVVKQLSPESVIVVDNCYGEFVETEEPLESGADVIIGSLIKNPGGGIATCGAYIAGSCECIRQISYRMTAPGIGMEVGSYARGYKDFYQGLFTAPHTVLQAVKSAMLFSEVFSSLGYNVTPKPDGDFNDIICSIDFEDSERLKVFCAKIQASSPVDSYVTPEAWDMPGYSDKVIMAAGCFTQGASIELSCDAPVKYPYTVYLQGALTYEHAVAALKGYLKSLL